MTVWRLTTPPFAATALDGRGAARYGGRWNPAGTRLVYTAEALSLAALELLVHLDADGVRHVRYVALPVALPADAAETLAANDLPPGWASPVAPPELAEIGRRWAASGRSLALRVPSAVVPVEANVLLNPLHPRFDEVTTGPPADWLYDARLLKG